MVFFLAISKFLSSIPRMKNNKKIFWFSIFLFAAIFCYHLFSSAFDHDEIQHLHATWLVSQGALPFTDFLEQHNPTLWYLFAPVLQLASGTEVIFIVRTFDVLLLAASLFFIWKILRSFFDQSLSRWLILLTMSCFMFTRNMLEFRPDPFMTFFILVSYFFWIKTFREQKRKDALVSGLAIGLATVILQKALVFLLLMLGMWGVAFLFAPFWMFERKKIFAQASIFFVALLFPLLIFFIFILEQGHFDDYWFWNVTFNKFFYLQAMVSAHISWVSTVSRSFAQSGLVWVLGFLGAFVVCVQQRRNFSLLSLFFISLLYFVGFMRSGFPLAQYLLPFFPVLILFSGFAWQFLEKQHRRFQFFLPLLVLLTLIESFAIMILYQKNTFQLQCMNHVLETTKQNDVVMIQPPFHPIFRNDASFFWYNNNIIMKAVSDYAKKYGGENKGEKDVKRVRENLPAVLRKTAHAEDKIYPDLEVYFKNYKPMGKYDLYRLR